MTHHGQNVIEYLLVVDRLKEFGKVLLTEVYKVPRTAVTFAITFALMLPSCVYHQKYPDGWDLPLLSSPTDRCKKISGTYLANGESDDGSRAKTPLINHLFYNEMRTKMTWLPFFVTSVSLTQKGDESIEITVWKGDEKVTSKSMVSKSGDFYCEDGWIKFKVGTMAVRC